MTAPTRRRPRRLQFSPSKTQAAREATGLTPTEVGAQIGKSCGTVNNWEAGRRRPRVDDLPALAEALNVRLDDLFAATGDEAA